MRRPVSAGPVSVEAATAVTPCAVTGSDELLLNWIVFELDTRSGELTRNGRKIKLQEQPFKILALLLERPGEMFSREELRQKLWAADTFVAFDDGLNTAVKKLRQALDDAADSPRYVETLPRRGYRFIGSVDHPISSDNQIPSLRVPSRSSALPYKNARKPAPETGRALDVDRILEGSVVRAGDRIRITVQLIEAVTDRHLSAESYERERDVLSLQRDVAEAVAR